MPEVAESQLPWHAPIFERALRLRNESRLPHAVMIDSARDFDMSGFGKYLSMLLLCDQADGISYCGACEACKLMQLGTYADFNLVTFEPSERTKKLSKFIRIEQIRKLIYELILTPRFDRLKIAVILPAEAMTVESANALLKTLEEPASRVLILLLTRNSGRIPITVRSRCQIWNLPGPTREAALSWLAGKQLNSPEADEYLDFADGDPLLALRLRDLDYATLVQKFKSGFPGYLRGEQAISKLCRELLAFEAAAIRRLVNMTLAAYCYRSSGVDADANPVDGADRRQARQLFELRQRAQRQLSVEENNLDLQLQLEDVLISLKQILTRRTT